MSYLLGRRIRSIGITDFFFTSTSIIFFVGGMWILATDVHRGEVPMVIGSIGALICAGLKSFGLWTCYKLIIVMNLYNHQTDKRSELVQSAFGIFLHWLTTKKILLIVPVLTLVFYIGAYCGCRICILICAGWVALEISLIYYGGVYVDELRKRMEQCELNANPPLVHQLTVVEHSV